MNDKDGSRALPPVNSRPVKVHVIERKKGKPSSSTTDDDASGAYWYVECPWTVTMERATFDKLQDKIARLRECEEENIALKSEIARFDKCFNSVTKDDDKSKDSIDQLAKRIRHANTKNGWNVTVAEDWDDTYKIPAILALVHSEVSESLEAFRNNDIVNFQEEIADIIIRVLDCAGAFNFSIDAEIEKKLEKNKTRGYKHGKKV